MERMSRPVHDLRQRYDVVVVGSGYGGGIAASRFSRAGRSVCVLERGKELHPGEYPDRLMAAPRHVQANTKRGRLGSPTALFDFHLGSDISALVGCGLGGTSLINANVALRAKPWVFDDTWPAEFRDRGAEVLEPYYRRAEEMLGSTPYPADLQSPKLSALARSGAALGTDVERLKLNVTFETGPNAAGVMQHACVQCGDCVTGCNFGAKNTVLMNYLPDAHHHGAEIFTEVQVRSVHRRDDGTWLVSFRDLSSGRRRFGAPTQFVTADVLILAAGSLGSTEILLRSQAAGLPLSRRVGRSFTGNGDVLAFAFDTDASARCIGSGPRRTTQDTAVGPCITGVIDLTDPDFPHRGMIIQEGSVPGLLAPIVGAAWAASAVAFGVDDSRGLGRIGRRLRQVGGTLLGPRRGPADRTLTYLVMSIDDDTGRLVLTDDRLDIRWPNVGKRPVFERDNTAVAHAAQSIGGTFVPNPMWTTPFGHSLITVQPLGGCDMGDHARHGVVNHKGQVFAGAEGTDVHEGLYVADGAIVPRPIGANPSLTISALAERVCELIAADRGWNTSAKRRRTRRPAHAAATAPGLRFSERMEGFFSTRVRSGYEAGYAQGRADGSRIEMVLTMDYEDLGAALGDQAHPARISGTVLAPELSPRRLTVTDGEFRLLDPDPDHVETWHMIYRLELLSEEGKRFTLEGFKLVRERGSLHAWPDTTTLFVRAGDADGNPLGVGIMRIGAGDFLRLLRTIEAVNAPDPDSRRGYRFAFMRMFLRKLLSIYGGPLDEGRFPDVPITSFVPITGARPLRLPDPEVSWCDGHNRWHAGIDRGPGEWPGVGRDAELRFIRYRAGDKGPVLVAPGFGMSATSYLADTTEQNLTEFLCDLGYDVWLFDYRAGIELPSARTKFTFDEVATEDWPRAVARVREVTGAETVQAIGHCMGSMSFQMAMLAGLVGVRSAVCSQGMAIVDPSPLVRLKNALKVGHILAGIGVRLVEPDTRRRFLPQALDIALRAVPMARDERCGQALCRWVNAIYGCTHRHEQLNDATHRALHRMFGVGDLTALRHIALMMQHGRVIDHRGRDVYVRYPERMAIPLLLLQGTHNYIFRPKGSDRTLRWLRDRNGPDLYERLVLRDYAHLDALIGRNAHEDVYPKIGDHLDRYALAR